MRRKIKLLGEPAILDEDGQSQAVRGYQAWALLARVLLTRMPLDRRSLAAELFPETADPLGALRWCLASLRKALNSADCLRGDPIEADLPGDVDVDVLRLDRDDFDIEGAGQLLGTIEPRCSPEFSTWLLVERERIAGIVEARIRQEAIRAISVEGHERAIRLAELGVRRRPFDEGFHILLMKSLALAGRYQAALDHVDATETVFLAELGEKPSQALRSAARRTISAPPGGISAGAFVNSLIQSGLAALSAGAADAGIDCLRRAANEAEKCADRQLQAKATLELGTALVHAVRGFDDEGSVLLRQSTELARQAGSASLAASGFRELGYVEALAGRRPGAADYLATAAGLAEDRDTLAGIHAVAGFNLVDWGRVYDGLEQYGLSLEHARSSGNRRREIWALGLGAWGHAGRRPPGGNRCVAGRLPDADRRVTLDRVPAVAGRGAGRILAAPGPRPRGSASAPGGGLRAELSVRRSVLGGCRRPRPGADPCGRRRVGQRDGVAGCGAEAVLPEHGRVCGAGGGDPGQSGRDRLTPGTAGIGGCARTGMGVFGGTNAYGRACRTGGGFHRAGSDERPVVGGVFNRHSPRYHIRRGRNDHGFSNQNRVTFRPSHD